MRACVIAAAVIAFTQPALAAKSHKNKSHHHHVSRSLHHHHAARGYHVHARLRRAAIEAAYAMPQAFAPAGAIERPAMGAPPIPGPSWQQAWAPPAAPQAVPFGEAAPRMRRARLHDGALDSMIERHA